jgi:hypothetical protein
LVLGIQGFASRQRMRAIVLTGKANAVLNTPIKHKRGKLEENILQMLLGLFRALHLSHGSSPLT